MSRRKGDENEGRRGGEEAVEMKEEEEEMAVEGNTTSLGPEVFKGNSCSDCRTCFTMIQFTNTGKLKYLLYFFMSNFSPNIKT